MRKVIYFLGILMAALLFCGVSFWFFADIIKGGEAWIAVEITYLDDFYSYYSSPKSLQRLFDAGYNSCLADQAWNEKGKEDLNEIKGLKKGA